MSNVFSIAEANVICNNKVKNTISFIDAKGNRVCYTINFDSTNVTFLVNQQENHNKFYELYKIESSYRIDIFYALVKYGRIGNKAAEHLYTFNSISELNRFCSDKEQKEQNKGYRKIYSFEEYKEIIHNNE